MSKWIKKRRMLIVCEGQETEYNYFVGLRTAFETDLEVMATTISVKRGNGGNARNIVQKAIKEAKKFDPKAKQGDRVFLLMDTEGVGRAPELPSAEKLAEKNNIRVIYSSPSIEYWLLCHFPKPKRHYFKDCNSVIAELNKLWNSAFNHSYDKSDQDIFQKLSSRFSVACSQSLKIDLHNMQTVGAASGVNPSSQIYELVAILLGAKTGEKCPISGTWKLVSDSSVTAKLEKGDVMPGDTTAPKRWRL